MKLGQRQGDGRGDGNGGEDDGGALIPSRPRPRDGDGDVPLLAARTKAPCSSQAEQLMAVLVSVL